MVETATLGPVGLQTGVRGFGIGMGAMGRWHVFCTTHEATAGRRRSLRATGGGRSRREQGRQNPMSSGFAGVLPGARVRGEDGFIGTVERLEHHWAASDERPDRMIVRSDDGRWRYTIPLMFVSSVSQGALYPLVVVGMHKDDLLHYVSEEVLPERLAQGAVPGRAQSEARPEAEEEPEVLRVPVAEEELVAHKQPAPLGMAHVHKGVETREAQTRVPVYHEEAQIERIPADQFDPTAATNPNEVIIPVVEERLVVRREQVVTEYIRVRKALVAEQRELLGEVRREYVTVTEDGREGQPPATRFDSRSASPPRDPWTVAPHDDPAADQTAAEGSPPEAAATDTTAPAS